MSGNPWGNLVPSVPKLTAEEGRKVIRLGTGARPINGNKLKAIQGAIPNPWGLTKREQAVLSALCEHGSMRAAGAALHVTYKTVESHGVIIRKKMSCVNTLTMVLVWDRFVRNIGEKNGK
jgi:DNA-binding NarL/FixJ family response regulator